VWEDTVASPADGGERFEAEVVLDRRKSRSLLYLKRIWGGCRPGEDPVDEKVGKSSGNLRGRCPEERVGR